MSFKLVQVHWEDICHEHSWLDKDCALSAAQCVSVGWVAKEDDKYLWLAADRPEREDCEKSDYWGAVRVFPKGCIKRVLDV